MKTFILIHGSWHSAWNWHRLLPILEKMGHKVIALDLPGMGRDKTPVAGITMTVTVDKICSVIDSVKGNVILVGHSKNGIMISQAAEYRPGKIEKLVYLAAYLIPNGKTQQDYAIYNAGGVLKPFVDFHEATNSSTLRPEIYKEGLYGDCDDSIMEMAKMILSDEPVASSATALQLTDENYGSVPRYYIECTQDKAITPFLQQKMYNEMPCKKVYQMEASHSPFFSQPKQLAEILEEIANDK